MDCESAETKGKKREEQHRDAIVVLGKRHRVLVREKGSSVKEMQRIVKGLMIVPPHPICDRVRVAVIGHGIAQVENPGPRHEGSQQGESEEGCNLSEDIPTRHKITVAASR